MITSIASHLRSSLGAGRRVRAWLRRLFVLWLVLFLAACVGAAPTTSPAPAAVPPADPTATATPAPTATPALAAWAPAPSVPATAVLVRGGAALARRVLPAAELAQRLGAVGGGWRLLADDAGQIGFYAGAGGALVLAQGPAGYAWDAAAQVWVRGAAIVIPDVWAPGGGAMPPAEAAFLFADGGGALRVGVVYGPAAPAAGLAGAGAAVVRLPDGATLYVVEPVTAELAAGQALERDGAGDLRLLNPDGSYWRRITSWADVRAADEVHQAGAFAGPFSDWPDVPYAPVSWVAEDKAVYSFDPNKQEATVKETVTGPIVALARQNDKGAWEWKRVEPTLALKPATMTKDIASRFLAGGEMMTEEQLKAFAGRVYQVSGISEAPLWLLVDRGLSVDPQALTNNELLAKIKAYSKYKDLNTPYIPLRAGDGLVLTKNGIWVARQYKENTLPTNNTPIFMTADGEIRQIDQPRFTQIEKIIKDRVAYLWDDQRSRFVIPDAYPNYYQARFVSDDGYWKEILPHERQYLLTPDQQIAYIVKKLKTEASAYNEPYVFDDYITTKRREDVPQIVILVTNTEVSSQEQQWINDWFLNDGKNLTPEQKQRVQALIPKIGNGFTRRQAQDIARWIDQLLDQSEYAREVFRIADVRFIAQDNEGLSKLTGTTGVKYAADPNNYNRSLWGIEGATYYPDLASLIIAHETARVYCHQTVGPGYNEEKDMKPVEQRLLKEAPPPFSF